jgi:hypothetical protein
MIDLSSYDEDDSIHVYTKYVRHSTVYNGIYYFQAKICVRAGCALYGFQCQRIGAHAKIIPFAIFTGEGEPPTDWLEKLDLIIRFKQNDEFFAQFLPDD